MAYITHVDPKAKMALLVSGGGATSMEDLQFAGPMADDSTFAAGALVSYNSSGKIQAGLAAATSMPLFAINGATDYDSSQYEYNLLKDTKYQGQGTINTFVATGGFELATTEYNVTEGFTAVDYVKGTTLLTNDVSSAGQIEPAAADYSNATVLGCVSEGIASDRTGVNRARLRLGQKALLRFWTMFIPPVAAGT